MGQVLTAGAGQMPARQAAVAAGIGWDVPSLTINKMCLSGIDAIALADQLIRAGEFDVVVAGGQESMTQGAAPADGQPVGLQVRRRDGARPHGLRRSARRVHRPADGRAHRAAQRRRQVHPRRAGRVRCAIAPAGRRGVEGRRVRRRGGAGEDSAAQGRSAGVHRGRGHPRQHHRRVAGGAQAGVPQGRHHHRGLGVADLRRRVRGRGDEQGQGRGAGAGLAGARSARTAWWPGPDSTLQTQPANAIKKAIAREGISVDQLDVMEINEAFSAVSLASTKELGVDPDKVNVNGGAIAIGHPIGMSGARDHPARCP